MRLDDDQLDVVARALAERLTVIADRSPQPRQRTPKPRSAGRPATPSWRVPERTAPQDLGWRQQALCRHPRYAHLDWVDLDPVTVPDQQKVCAVCPVAVDCLDFARRWPSSVGMYGGVVVGPKKKRRR